ncbi:hypothetical protein MMC30_001834 [Trapelia coarctata]|nr:hypothetical protein [Trapelia coarctata]
MITKYQPLEVLLVGSVPLHSASDVFTTALRALPGRLRRIPDDETGDRQQFIAWQLAVFPMAIVRSSWGGGPLPVGKAVNYNLSDLKPTGYDDRAIASHATLCDFRAAGTIPSDVRFPVSLPTSMAVVSRTVEREYFLIIEPLYEERLLQSVRRIQDNIPASDLSMQWDLPIEIASL